MPDPDHPAHVRRTATDALTAEEVDAIRALLDAAFGSDPEEAFGEDDWLHALGGTHIVVERDGAIVAHAAVVERRIAVAGRVLRTGYVEAVGVLPAEQGRGLGTLAMREAGAIIAEAFELGALGTGSHHFYERLGWRTWQGPASVRVGGEELFTPDEDGFILVLTTARTPYLDVRAPISCEWRPGDVW